MGWTIRGTNEEHPLAWKESGKQEGGRPGAFLEVRCTVSICCVCSFPPNQFLILVGVGGVATGANGD